MRRVIFLAIALLLVSRGAEAQKTNAAAAERLFEEGRALMADKRYAEACPKLAASQRLDPGVGTLLNLGECYERNGQTASAWATYREAEARAEQEGQSPRGRFAAAHARALAPQLSRLTLRVPPATKVTGLTLHCDGHPVDEAAWGTAIPVDPGSHEIEARAPGYRSFTTKVEVDRGAERSLDVPVLVAAPAPAPPPAPPPPPIILAPPPPDKTGQVYLGYGVGALGVAALAVGSVFGVSAFSTYGDADKNHCTQRDCDAEGISLIDDARQDALVSSILFGASAVALVSAGILLWTARPATRSPRATFGRTLIVF